MTSAKKMDVVDLTLSDDDAPAASFAKSHKGGQAGTSATRKPASKPAISKQSSMSAASSRNGVGTSSVPGNGQNSNSKQRHTNGEVFRNGEHRVQSRTSPKPKASEPLTSPLGQNKRSQQSPKPIILSDNGATTSTTPVFKMPRVGDSSSSQQSPSKDATSQESSKSSEKNPLKRPVDQTSFHSDVNTGKKAKTGGESLRRPLLRSPSQAVRQSTAMMERSKKITSAQTIDLTSSPPPKRQASRPLNPDHDIPIRRSPGRDPQALSPSPSRTERSQLANGRPYREGRPTAFKKEAGSWVGIPVSGESPGPGTPSTRASPRKNREQLRSSSKVHSDGDLAQDSTRSSLSYSARKEQAARTESPGTVGRILRQPGHLRQVFDNRQENLSTAERSSQPKAASTTDPRLQGSQMAQSSYTADLALDDVSYPTSASKPADPELAVQAQEPRSRGESTSAGAAARVLRDSPRKASGSRSDAGTSDGALNDASRSKSNGHWDPDPKIQGKRLSKLSALDSREDLDGRAPTPKDQLFLEMSATIPQKAPQEPLPNSTAADERAARSRSPDHMADFLSRTHSASDEADLQLRTEAMEGAEHQLPMTTAPPKFAVPTFAASAMKTSIYANLPLTSQVEKVLGKHLEQMRGDNEYWAATFLQRARLKKVSRNEGQPTPAVSFASMKPINSLPPQKKVALGDKQQMWQVEKIGPGGKALGVTSMNVRYTSFATQKRDVANYAHYVGIQHNMLAPNVTNLHCWPYFGDDFEMAQAENLHEQYNLDIDLREEKLLLLLRAQQYEPYVNDTLQDLECSWSDLLRYLIEEQEKKEQAWAAKEPTEKQQKEEEKRRKIHNLSARSSRSEAILAALPPTTPEKRARVGFLCDNFEKMAKFNIWHVARRSDEANPVSQDAESDEPSPKLTCRLCLRVGCPFHGELNERPEDDSESDTTAEKDKVLATDIVNPPRSNYRTRVAFPPASPETTAISFDFRSKTRKKDATYWRNDRLYQEPDQLGPFYPCSHPGSSCEEAECSCYNECRPCEKTAAHARRKGQSASMIQNALASSMAENAIQISAAPAAHDDSVLSGRCRNAGMQRGVPKQTLLGDSGVHGLGLYACENIRENEFVGEYKGEIITKEEAERRGAVYEHQKLTYLFQLNLTQEIDSTYFGNKVRFINHASRSKANLYPRIIMVNAVHRIALYANRPIAAGQELFFDYGPKFPDEQLGGKKQEKSAPHVRNVNLVKDFVDHDESEDEVGNLRAKAVDRPAICRGKGKARRGGARTGAGRKPQQQERQAEMSAVDQFREAGRRLQEFNISDDPRFDLMEVDEEAGADDEDYEEDGESEASGSSGAAEESEDE
ncbi:uncharacterized protein LTR77_010907 [Saxophila tyrrhenica]|uniref:SET domain-containing protein n=1 Tax=Saxophila tyrrhenica TaxID=1690608 RepID=A0AAV9NUG2_9PEZI|nr:hypothetical protein LTR77_010907 [Saxophila tyrrhenica]